MSPIGLSARRRPRHDSSPAESAEITRLCNRFLLAVFNHRAAPIPPRPGDRAHSRSYRERSARGPRRRLLIRRTLVPGGPGTSHRFSTTSVSSRKATRWLESTISFSTGVAG